MKFCCIYYCNLSQYNFSEYDLIIIDETQRIYKNQLNIIVERAEQTNIKCIFSYDPVQCLATSEITNNIPGYLKNRVTINRYKLTGKIRTNIELASFIKNLFDLSKRNNEIKYSNIEIQYFSDERSVRKYVDMLDARGHKVINYTPSRYKEYPHDRYQNITHDTAHQVIGQEYEEVVAVIDSHFYYKNGRLSTAGWTRKPYYHPTKMLFQIVSRTRKKLNIVILNNETMLMRCLQILNNK